MNNITQFSDCYGCGMCAIVCPKQIISIQQNINGFYEPVINNDNECIHCGQCLKVCSYADEQLAQNNDVLASYAAWSKDPVIRKKCSSGGVGFEISKILLEQGYKICGVRYNPTLNRAEHYISVSKEELVQSAGSKYIQSYTVDGFRSIDRKEKYLVVGTPCQIDLFRRYIRKNHIEENFILMDFFCHGVPSKKMWDKYLSETEKITGKVIYASWRNKITGWHDSLAMDIDGEHTGEKVNWHDSYNLLIKGEKTFLNSRYSQGDAFYQLFLSDNCLGKACYDHCKFKFRSSSADIRIGDLWGKKYQENEDGITGVAVFSKKGKSVLMQSNCEFVEEHFDTVAEGQMKAPAKRGRMYPIVQKMLLNDDTSIKEINLLILKEKKRRMNIERIKHPLRTLLNIIKKIK